MSICIHCGCESVHTRAIYGTCEHCTPKEYLTYKENKKDIIKKSDSYLYDIEHYDEYNLAIYVYNKNRPKDILEIKKYSKSWLTRMYNRTTYEEQYNDVFCVVRVLMTDAEKLAKEFGIYEVFKSTSVPKTQICKKFKLTDKVDMCKYYTHLVKADDRRSDYIRHNAFLQGKGKDVRDILSRTCGTNAARGCFVPIQI